MTALGSAPARLPVPVAAERIVSSGLRWLYALVLLDLAGAGAGAGQALYTAYDLGHYSAVVDCLQASGLGLLDPTRLTGDSLAARVAEFTACTGAYNRGQGIAMLAGAMAMPVLAGLLTLVGALAAARRTRPARRTGVDSPAVRAVAERFAYWCDVVGLHDRRRPELVIARPGRWALRAYTTALPGRRPRVVVPVGYAYAPVEELDLILLHELAHVRMRDVAWASATWWTGWLNVPVLLAAFGPLALRPALWGPRVAAAVGLAAVLSLVTLLLRAAVLRRRERLADRYAVVRGGCLGALSAAAGRAHQRASLPARLFAGHFRGARRVAAATTADARWEAGATVAAAAGLLWMFGLQSAQVVLTDLAGLGGGDARLVPSLALTAAALGWAATLVPLWSRSPGPAPPRVAGATAGLVAGFYLQPPGTLVPVGATLAGDHLLAAVLWTVPALAGAAAVAALLAAAARGARGTRATAAAAAATVGAAAALATATDTVWTLLREHWLYGSVAVDRHMFAGYGAYWWAAWTPALLLAAAVAVALATRAGLRREVPVVLGAAIAGGGVAIAATQLRIGAVVEDAAVLRLLYDRWWMCALAGWAVTVVALLRRRSLAVALPAGAAAAVLAGLLQYGRDLVAGRTGHGLTNLVGFVRMPVWLLCCAVLLTLPALAALARAAPIARGRWWAAGATALAASAALLVAGGSLAPVTGREGDLDAFRAAVSSDGTSAADVLGRVRAALPAGWTPIANADNSPDTGVAPPACAQRWAANRAAERARGATADERATAELSGAALRLELGLASYPGADAARARIDEAADDLRICPVWTVDFAPADDHRLRAAVAGGGAPSLPYPGYLIRNTLTFVSRGRPMCIAVVYGGVQVGHDVATATVSFPLPARSSVTEEQWRGAETTATGALHATVAALGG